MPLAVLRPRCSQRFRSDRSVYVVPSAVASFEPLMVLMLHPMVTFRPLKVPTLLSMVSFEPLMVSFGPSFGTTLAAMVSFEPFVVTFGPLKVPMLPFVASFEPSMASFEPLLARIEPSMVSFGPSTVRTLPSTAPRRGGVPSAGARRLARWRGRRLVAMRRPYRRHGPADGHGLRLRSSHTTVLTFSKKKKTIDGRTGCPNYGISHGERGAGS